MKIFISVMFLFVLTNEISAQHKKKKEFSIAIMNAQTAMPFDKFSALGYKDLHPGIEAGFGFNWKTKPKHDWYQEFKAGYFFHRFVQHGIPVYTNFGYRYKFSKKLSLTNSLGAGYLHSIPATQKFKLNQNGFYENNIGVGRIQTMVIYSIGMGYILKPTVERPIRLFISYQQRLQLPFVKSYVPILPYNSFMIGISKSLKRKNK